MHALWDSSVLVSLPHKIRRSQIIAMPKLSSRYDCIRQYARSVQWVAITATPTLGESGA